MRDESYAAPPEFVGGGEMTVSERAWCCPGCCDFYWFDAEWDEAECPQCSRGDQRVMCVEYVPATSS